MTDTFIDPAESSAHRPIRIHQRAPRPAPERAVALVGTYPPTACGLATFTANLAAAIAGPHAGWRTPIVRVLDEPEWERSSDVAGHWLAGDPGSLRATLGAAGPLDAILLQHEFGLFGGPDGEDVLELVDGSVAPVITVLHTVLAEPSPNQRRILDRLVERSAAVVVQSKCARHRLLATCARASATPAKIRTIPHGAADNTGPGPRLGPSRTVLTWGLLSPGKGVEHGIRALARLDPGLPRIDYVVAGRTHPKVLEREGERYRNSLRRLADSLGVGDRVHLDASYRDWRSLRALIRGADVVLLPYDSVDQVTSGVLVEAIASAKPTIATPFPHAVELLADGVGIIVGRRDPDSMSQAIGRVLSEPGLANRLTDEARRAAEPLLWPAVGATYRTLITRVASRAAVA